MPPLEPVDAPAHASSPLLKTSYADTVEAVEAAELEVIGELHELVASWRLSPWQAAFALFNPIVEEATDVA